MKSAYNPTIAYLKALGIILMVFGHSFVLLVDSMILL